MASWLLRQRRWAIILVGVKVPLQFLQEAGLLLLPGRPVGRVAGAILLLTEESVVVLGLLLAASPIKLLLEYLTIIVVFQLHF